MTENNLKGLAMDKETIIAFVIIIFVFIIVVAFLYKTFVPGTEIIYSDMELRAECGNWQVDECRGEVPSKLSDIFEDDEKAKEFCNCPGYVRPEKPTEPTEPTEEPPEEEESPEEPTEDTTPPTISDTKVEPSTVEMPAEDEFHFLITAKILDLSGIDEVNAIVSEPDGQIISKKMYDNGPSGGHGDAVEGDNVYSTDNYRIASHYDIPGTYYVNIEACDTKGNCITLKNAASFEVTEGPPELSCDYHEDKVSCENTKPGKCWWKDRKGCENCEGVVNKCEDYTHSWLEEDLCFRDPCDIGPCYYSSYRECSSCSDFVNLQCSVYDCINCDVNPCGIESGCEKYGMVPCKCKNKPTITRIIEYYSAVKEDNKCAGEYSEITAQCGFQEDCVLCSGNCLNSNIVLGAGYSEPYRWICYEGRWDYCDSETDGDTHGEWNCVGSEGKWSK